MKEVFGDVWDYYDKGHWIVITTNGIVEDGRAVMGKGIALEAKQRHPELPAELGRLILCYGNTPNVFRELRLLTFPTKYHWREKSSLSLIEESCMCLINGIKRLDKLQYVSRFYMPRPGCGNGRLDWEDVKPTLEKYLDDRFIVVERIRTAEGRD